MNCLHPRKGNTPVTPNLEEIKQKIKSKSRRKPGAIPTTNPPTPKPHRAQIHIKQVHEKQLDSKQQPVFCSMHPEVLATRSLESQPKIKLCNKCAIRHNEGNVSEQESKLMFNLVQREKRNELQYFRNLIKNFGLKLQDAESTVRSWSYESDESFFKQKDYIEQSFDLLSSELEQKKRELLGCLMQSQQKINQSINTRTQSIEDKKSAINRYIVDIENNYDDIIQALSYEQFEDIMERYQLKIAHFQKQINQIVNPISMTVYIPTKQIEKYMAKASIYTYPPLENQETPSNPNRTLQRYPTQKHNLCLDGSNKNFFSNHQESINQMGQHRRSRDRDFVNGFRHKENLHLDNYNYR